MTANELSRGLIYIFQAMPNRIKRIEQYRRSHTVRRVEQYLRGSFELSLKKETAQSSQ